MTSVRYANVVETDYLLISKLNTVVFCPRRYYIEVVLGEHENNHHLIDGSRLHERTKRPGENVWVWSDRLGLVGVIDKLDLTPAGAVVTEYKKGWLGEHQSDRVQLAAQMICLEERGTAVSHGFIFYHATRRKQRVEVDRALRDEVEAAALQMRRLNASPRYPAPTDNRNKCRGCSVKEACQPTLARKAFKEVR